MSSDERGNSNLSPLDRFMLAVVIAFAFSLLTSAFLRLDRLERRVDVLEALLHR